jgi:hypothetical protein
VLVLHDDRPAVGASQNLRLLSRELQEPRWRLPVLSKTTSFGSRWPPYVVSALDVHTNPQKGE